MGLRPYYLPKLHMPRDAGSGWLKPPSRAAHRDQVQKGKHIQHAPALQVVLARGRGRMRCGT